MLSGGLPSLGVDFVAELGAWRGVIRVWGAGLAAKIRAITQLRARGLCRFARRLDLWLGRSIIGFDRVVDNAGGYGLVGEAGRWRLDDAGLEYEARVSGQARVSGRRTWKRPWIILVSSTVSDAGSLLN